MIRFQSALVFFCLLFAPAYAASDRQPAPPGAPRNAPGEFTRFTAAELTRGFIALAFGSDLRLGSQTSHVRRFDRPIRAHVVKGGSVDRTTAMKAIITEYAQKVPGLRLTLTEDENAADITLRLTDEKNFRTALEAAFGRAVTQAFIAKTDPQCMTSVQAGPTGEIIRSISFVIVDQGDDVFLDCAYHELLHAFGLSNHDQSNAFTTLNQNRMVGYLAAYDRALLDLLYDPRLMPGMTRSQVRALLPKLLPKAIEKPIEGLPAAAPANRGG